jgi:transcriptional regulator with PAS, ATPase and Fis domain
MKILPGEVCERMEVHCVGRRNPACLLAGPDGRVRQRSGDLGRYGMDPAASEVPDFLTGLLPLGGADLHLPLVRLRDGCYAEILGFPGAEGDWIVLLDAGEQAGREAALQQALNETVLLREESERLLHQVRRDNEDLEAVLDQLSVMIAAVDVGGRLTFLSRRGEELLAKRRNALAGRAWERALPLSAEDREELRAQFLTPAAERRRVTVRIAAAGGRQYRMEADVHDDPRDAGRRLIFFYDVTEVADLRALLGEPSGYEGMLGRSRPMRDVFDLVRKLAPLDSTVLIEGETGTGKELVARAIHFSSRRSDRPFVVVNCAGLSDSLINSELFGHRRGAFTGAIQDQAGLFEAAHGGSIVMDEIGDIPMNTQTRILRVLEEREVVRIGETQPRKIDIRVVAATNKNLAEEVRRGRFREDLLYRIRVARVLLPPLRERREDIPLLAEAFLRKSCAATGKQVTALNDDTLEIFRTYPWPGNVRELRNAIEFGVIGCGGAALEPRDLPPEIRDYSAGASGKATAAEPRAEGGGKGELRERAQEALRAAGGNRARAAVLLGVSRATFYRHLGSRP